MTSLPVTRDVIHTENKSAGWLHTVLADPNLFIIGAVCAIGLLVTLNLIFRFAIFGSSIKQIAEILG